MSTVTYTSFWDEAKAMKDALLEELGKVIPADKEPDRKQRNGNHQWGEWGDGVTPVEYPPIKLTCKGNRFGDVVRDSLADPESSLSKVIREFNAWKKVCQREPEKFNLELDGLGFILVRTKGTGMGRSGVDTFEHVSDSHDMRTWWNRELRFVIPPAKYLKGYKN